MCVIPLPNNDTLTTTTVSPYTRPVHSTPNHTSTLCTPCQTNQQHAIPCCDTSPILYLIRNDLVDKHWQDWPGSWRLAKLAVYITKLSHSDQEKGHLQQRPKPWQETWMARRLRHLMPLGYTYFNHGGIRLLTAASQWHSGTRATYSCNQSIIEGRLYWASDPIACCLLSHSYTHIQTSHCVVSNQLTKLHIVMTELLSAIAL